MVTLTIFTIDDALINFQFDNGNTINTGTGKKDFELVHDTDGPLEPVFSGGFMSTNYSTSSGKGPQFTGWENIYCLRYYPSSHIFE